MNNKKLKIKNFLKEFSKIAGMLLACAALGFFLAIGIRSSSPDRIAKKYFSYYVTNNYEEMYKMIDVKESEFINLENFKIKCEGEKIYGSIKDYKISKPVKQGDTITYVATYKMNDSDSEHTYTITLDKQDYNNFLFFTAWRVSVKRVMINDFKISVPVNTSVNLDGVDVSKFKTQTSKDGTQDIYKINNIFSGDHTVSVNLDATGEITKTQYITNDSKEMVLTTSDFAMKPDVQKKLFEYSTFVVNAMYQYSMDATKNFDDISILYNNTDDAQKSAKSTFDSINKAVVREDGGYIKQLEIKDINPQIAAFTYPDKVTVTVNYNYGYTALTAMTTLSGITSEYSGEVSHFANVYFNLVYGDWKIVKVDMKCIDYNQQ